MRVSLHFIDGRTVNGNVDLDPKKWSAVFQSALQDNSVIQLDGPDGSQVGINPRGVIDWKVKGGASKS